MKQWISLKLATGLLVIGTLGCAGKTTRIDPDSLSEIEIGSTVLTSQDFRSISSRMARSLVQLPQIQNSTTPPKVAFVSVANNSDMYIDGDKFLSKMRTELIKHAQGRMVFLDRALMQEIERENREKNRGRLSSAGEATPLGADFFLTGEIDSIEKLTNTGRTSYMRLSFRLTDAGSSAIVWEDDYEIKKHDETGFIHR